jgi:cytochrome c biogenesis protein
MFNLLWQFFTSVKLTVGLLLALAATSIIGTLIPQNAGPADYLRTYGDFWYRIFAVFDFFDMYHSWWFQVLMLTLALNIIVCSVERLGITWKKVFVSQPTYRRERFTALPHRAEIETSRSVEPLAAHYEAYAAKRFRHLHTEQAAGERYIFGETGRWTRLGVYVTHLSVILLLIGGLIGSIFGFEGYVNIKEGEAVAQIQLRNSPRLKPLGFQIQCNDFHVSFYESGTPREYRSSLTIIDNGQPVVQKDIIVNDPLRYRGINIYQSSYGPLAPTAVTLKLTSRASGKEYLQPAAIGQAFELPEDQGTFTVKAYRQSYVFRGQSIGEAVVGMLTPVSGVPTEVALPIRFPSFDRMRQGAFLIAIADVEQRYFTGLQVTRDPGVWVVYAGFIMMILGCLITFFMSHQRYCIAITRHGQQTRVVVTGTTNKNKLGMQHRVERLAHRLKRQERNVP